MDGESKQKILVVEDSDVIQRLIEVCLRPAGFVVEMRGDGPSGIDAAVELLPAVVVLDVGLPGMDGWEVLGHLRQDPKTAHLQVLVLTAHAHDQTRELAEKSGASAFLSKPFRPDELRRIVGELAAEARTATGYPRAVGHP
jgi:CheY-like chemotaxis protein